MVRGAGMQRWTALIFGGLLLTFLTVVILNGRSTTDQLTAETDASPTALADAAADPPDALPPLAIGDEPAGEPGSPVADAAPEAPPLPGDAPKSVRFGAILVTYAGAQLAPKGARTKAKALEIATALLPAAEDDFAEAVKKGDPGSTSNAGRIPQGILEPHVEYALFTLAKGAVHDEPVDTPRGYWIVRRIK